MSDEVHIMNELSCSYTIQKHLFNSSIRHDADHVNHTELRTKKVNSPGRVHVFV